jgi:CheY-like chemotaxis protein
MGKKNVLVLEDDPRQALWIADLIRTEFPDADVKLLESENAFIQFVSTELSEWRPDYALLDILIQYYSIGDLAQETELLPFDKLQPSGEGGLRCAKVLQQYVPTCRITLMTVMDQNHVEFQLLQKGADGFRQGNHCEIPRRGDRMTRVVTDRFRMACRCHLTYM